MFEQATAPTPRSVRRWSGVLLLAATSLLLGCGGGGRGAMMAQGPDGGGGAASPGGGGAGGAAADAGTDGAVSDAGATDAASDGVPNDSPITINVTVDRCPTVLAAASPSTAKSDRPVAVDATADDPDDDALTYLWSAPAGTFAMPAAASTTYTCTNAGHVMLTVTVSDGKCQGQAAIPFTCLATP